MPSARGEREYEGLLEATLGLIDASAAFAPNLSRPRRIVMGAAILRVCEAEGSARAALASPEQRRLERAAARVERACMLLEDAGRDAVLDAARRRSLSLA